MSLIGKEISDFTVQAYVDGSFKEVKKSDVLGKWAVFFFYPADFTFVCPTELGDLADFYEEFKEAGCEIYSVSEDTHFVHKAWADASDTIKKIQYPMLGDPAGKLAREFGVLDEEAGQAFRGTFILNPEGKICNGTPRSYCARFRLPGLWRNMEIRYVLQSGNREKRR